MDGALLFQSDNVSEVKKYYTRIFDMINEHLHFQSDNLRQVKKDHTRTFVCDLWTSSLTAK